MDSRYGSFFQRDGCFRNKRLSMLRAARCPIGPVWIEPEDLPLRIWGSRQDAVL